MIQIETFTFNAFEQNTYLLWDESQEAILIDAGCYDKEEREELRQAISQKNLKLKALVLTHSHIDHVLGAAFVQKEYGVPIISHPKDADTFTMNDIVAKVYGFPLYQSTQADSFVEEGEYISFGQSQLKVLFTPGHSQGHIALWAAEQNFCVSGDVLFRESVGRTDLPGGNWDILAQSIRKKIYTLPDQTTIFSGHGISTTVGHEKKYNPFVRA